MMDLFPESILFFRPYDLLREYAMKKTDVAKIRQGLLPIKMRCEINFKTISWKPDFL